MISGLLAITLFAFSCLTCGFFAGYFYALLQMQKAQQQAATDEYPQTLYGPSSGDSGQRRMGFKKD